MYIPVVALYGYVLTFTDHPVSGPSGVALGMGPLLAIVLAFGVPLGLSLAVRGRWSDRARLRRPFMLIGLACFGGLAVLFSLATRAGGGVDLAQLYGRWPLIVVLSAGAGTFPPAALAYLGDIIDRSVSGTSFGIYSIIFGSGLIVGPGAWPPTGRLSSTVVLPAMRFESRSKGAPRGEGGRARAATDL